MGELRRINTVAGDGSKCWLCGQQDDEVLFDAPAHRPGGPRQERFIEGYTDVQRVTLCYECEAMRRWHALDLGTPEEEMPAAVCYVLPVWSHAERARVTRFMKALALRALSEGNETK